MSTENTIFILKNFESFDVKKVKVYKMCSVSGSNYISPIMQNDQSLRFIAEETRLRAPFYSLSNMPKKEHPEYTVNAQNKKVTFSCPAREIFGKYADCVEKYFDECLKIAKVEVESLKKSDGTPLNFVIEKSTNPIYTTKNKETGVENKYVQIDFSFLKREPKKGSKLDPDESKWKTAVYTELKEKDADGEKLFALAKFTNDNPMKYLNEIAESGDIIKNPTISARLNYNADKKSLSIKLCFVSLRIEKKAELLTPEGYGFRIQHSGSVSKEKNKKDDKKSAGTKQEKKKSNSRKKVESEPESEEEQNEENNKSEEEDGERSDGEIVAEDLSSPSDQDASSSESEEDAPPPRKHHSTKKSAPPQKTSIVEKLQQKDKKPAEKKPPVGGDKVKSSSRKLKSAQ